MDCERQIEKNARGGTRTPNTQILNLVSLPIGLRERVL